MSLMEEIVAKVEVKFNQKHQELLTKIGHLEAEQKRTNECLTRIEGCLKGLQGKGL